MPKFGWHSVFSTNFDRLIEKAYKACGQELTAVRSNYDFTYREGRTGTTLYKLHGCISQDRALGHKASMILTEHDYEEFDKYRQSIFSLLESALLTGDVLVIGQSLRDRHLGDLIKKVLGYKQEGAPGQVYVLVYDHDNLRAPLLEDRGARIAFGGIDEFVHVMAVATAAPAASAPNADTTLPLEIISTVDEVGAARAREPNVIRMFNGAPATYADIQSGATFTRAQTALLLDQIKSGETRTVAIIGAAGVGKTTLGRQLLNALNEVGYLAAEHRSDFLLQSEPWIRLEARLRQDGRRGVLLLDECTRYLRQANLLIEHVASLDEPALAVVMTANAAQWAPRTKSPAIFAKGRVVELSRLADADLHALTSLVEANRAIANLVQPDFKALTRSRRFARLRERCSADMFVCLKNIFANDSLDQILLAEFEDLQEDQQEWYRYIAALESVGMRVHRQLIMRMLRIRADQVAGLLARLPGIVDEFEISARDGIYGWATRHLVIARKITEYKFSSLEELYKLFKTIIENINPAVHTELQSLRDLCDTEFGIGRIGDTEVRKRLYRQLIEVAPAERIPWHRLIRELLEQNALEETEYLIRDAVEAVGADAPLDRYRVRLLIARADHTAGISAVDRVALLRKANEQAHKNVDKHRFDKHTYRMLCEVALKLIDKGEAHQLLDEALDVMRAGAQLILDPDMDRELKRFGDLRARLSVRA